MRRGKCALPAVMDDLVIFLEARAGMSCRSFPLQSLFLQRAVCEAGMACHRREGQHRSRVAHCDGNLFHGGFIRPSRRRLGATRELHFSASTFSSDGTIIPIGEDGSACLASAAFEIKLDKEFKYE